MSGPPREPASWKGMNRERPHLLIKEGRPRQPQGRIPSQVLLGVERKEHLWSGWNQISAEVLPCPPQFFAYCGRSLGMLEEGCSKGSWVTMIYFIAWTIVFRAWVLKNTGTALVQASFLALDFPSAQELYPQSPGNTASHLRQAERATQFSHCLGLSLVTNKNLKPRFFLFYLFIIYLPDLFGILLRQD